ncbi:helix-turn-helix domain-containing protein [Winogradskyella sediminis]|uniref:helix-turn-helix domain-containing protein n=1 Tax=Winogradskyella sediminis TaxID=1382466 RepID=UPI003AA88852
METQKILQIQDVTADQLKEILSSAVRNEISTLRAEFAQQSEKDELLTPDDVCALLGISKVTLWNWQKSGKIKSYGIGAKRFYKKAEILNHSLKQQK